jgi:hypothetical protein
MFNWFDKLLVKIAKKILNKYAPTGEFIAYINEQEEKVLKKLGGYGQPINETGVKSFIPEWMKTIKNTYDEYKDLIDVGAGAAKYYIDYKDQKRRNEIEEAAYNEYMKQVAAAGQEAQAAIDLNLTPMEVTNVPTTKADVSSFTAVAAHGGLMNLPTRQRKKYAYQGFVEDDDIEIMEPESESLGDFELRQEEGVNIGEQVFHDTGNPMTNAQQVWDSGQINQDDYIDFNDFFQSGDWQDHISKVEVEGDMQMAKNSYPFAPSNNPPYQPTEGAQDAAIQEIMAANGGIIGLRHGGRPGYQFGVGPQQGLMPQQGMMPQGMMPQQGLRPGYAEQGFVNPQPSTKPFRAEEESEWISQVSDTKEVDTINRIYEERGNEGLQAYLDRNPDLKDKYVIVADGMGGELTVMPNKLHPDNMDMDMEKITLDFENLAGGNAKGGLPKRVRKAPGGIMNLGGLEKDYRTTGGFVPIGGRERADDVPARLSKNEFVMTADAVRAAGGGSINKGAQRMYDTMKHLEASPGSKRMTA